MTDTTQPHHDRLDRRISTLEGEIEGLKEENQTLKSQLERTRKRDRGTVTRRQTLAGLLGGGALLGVASQPAAAASTTWSDADSDGLLEPPNHNGIDVTTVETDTLSVGNGAVQTSLDGFVVPVGKGLSAADAIDPSTTSTPIQDAINLVDATGVAADDKINGAGGVLLPPGEVDTPGEIYGLGGKRLIGWGRQSSIIRVTDSAANGFALDYAANRHMTYLDGFAISGGDRSARTAGSAINFGATTADADTSGEASVGGNIGQLYFFNWGGPDPVISSLGVFSNHWGYLRGERYDGSFIRMGGFDHIIERINLNHGSFDTPAIDLDGPGAYRIGSVNIGGNVGRALRLDKVNSRHAYFDLDYLNIEPDKAHGGTLTSAPAPVELLGASPARIGNVSQDDRLTSDHIIYLAGSINHAGPANDGPGRNRIGVINYTDASTGRPILVGAAPEAHSHYWGVEGHIDYGGYSTSSVVTI